MAESSVFEDIDTFRRWDSDYYHPIAMGFYDRAIGCVLDCLGARSGDLVLDAGCGPGEHSIRMARLGYRIHAIDISETVLDEARRRAEAAGAADRIRFQQADLTCLGFGDETYDRVFSWGVLIHIPEVDRAMSELVRILRPGGRLALYVTNDGALDHRLLAAARFAMRRPQPKLEARPLGHGCWYGADGGRLWVWRFDIEALTLRLELLGLRRICRIAGAFTETQRRFRGLPRRLLLRLNTAWFRLGLPAGPCMTNLLVFEKPDPSQGRRDPAACA